MKVTDGGACLAVLGGSDAGHAAGGGPVRAGGKTTAGFARSAGLCSQGAVAKATAWLASLREVVDPAYPRGPGALDMAVAQDAHFKHVPRCSIRRQALLALEERRPRQFHGMLGSMYRAASAVLLSEGFEFDKALLKAG